MEEYLIGTVAAEMPASFELEALKAQAVCARTYAVKKIIDHHQYSRGADLTDDIYSCQAYRPANDYNNFNPILLNKIKQAVLSTRGEIMLYDKQPIDALYHSTCGGKTESAQYAWFGNLPYLKSVKCQYCQDSKHYAAIKTIKCSQLATRYPSGGKANISIKIIDQTPTGRIKKLSINNHVISGEAFRKALGLPSTWFDLAIKGDNLVIKNHGYGHGVGLCQYGANGMARQGKSYQQILKTYYQNIEFYKMGY